METLMSGGLMSNRYGWKWQPWKHRKRSVKWLRLKIGVHLRVQVLSSRALLTRILALCATLGFIVLALVPNGATRIYQWPWSLGVSLLATVSNRAAVSDRI